jgi:tripartite-type tricarboxylate transporter receptor subunit TctC
VKNGLNWLRTAALAVALVGAMVAMHGPAAAQQYPTQEIRFICAFPAGSGADVLVRYFAEKLRPIVGRPIIVENKAGAGSLIATEFVAKSKPDGYTIYVHAATSVALSMYLVKNVPVDVAKTIEVVATINRQPHMILVDAKSPYKTLADLTAAMKVKGDKATYATASPISTIMGEIYKNATGVQAVEVPYKIAPDSLNEILSGKVDYAVHDPVFSLQQQREGRMRILAVSAGTRLAASPDLPTMNELGVPMDLTGWWAAMVPAGTPKPIVEQINKWFVQVVSTDETKKFLNSFGGDPFINTPEKAQEMFLKAIGDWGAHVKAAKLQPQG